MLSRERSSTAFTAKRKTAAGDALPIPPKRRFLIRTCHQAKRYGTLSAASTRMALSGRVTTMGVSRYSMSPPRMSRPLKTPMRARSSTGASATARHATACSARTPMEAGRDSAPQRRRPISMRTSKQARPRSTPSAVLTATASLPAASTARDGEICSSNRL